MSAGDGGETELLDLPNSDFQLIRIIINLRKQPGIVELGLEADSDASGGDDLKQACKGVYNRRSLCITTSCFIDLGF